MALTKAKAILESGGYTCGCIECVKWRSYREHSKT